MRDHPGWLIFFIALGGSAAVMAMMLMSLALWPGFPR